MHMLPWSIHLEGFEAAPFPDEDEVKWWPEHSSAYISKTSCIVERSGHNALQMM